MNREDIFDKHSTAYYDANEQKTEVLTKRRFERAVDEILEPINLKITGLEDALFMRKEIIERLDEQVKELEIDANYGNMLLTECENLKSDVLVAQEQRDRLQNRVIELEEVANELRQTIIAKQQREIRLENILAPHQELTQWIEEQIMDENDLDVSHDFIQLLYNKVYKINH